MKKTVLLYGIALAVMVALLKTLEYRYYVRDLSIEFYVGALAVFFTGIGVWAGLRLTQRKTVIVAASPFEFDPARLEKLNISKREFEVLELMAKGMSNQEIAEALFVSLNTIKTHSANLFQKLEVNRRTQAIKKAKELSLLP